MLYKVRFPRCCPSLRVQAYDILGELNLSFSRFGSANKLLIIRLFQTINMARGSKFRKYPAVLLSYSLRTRYSL